MGKRVSEWVNLKIVRNKMEMRSVRWKRNRRVEEKDRD